MTLSDWAYWVLEVILLGIGLAIIAVSLAAIRYHWERRALKHQTWR